MESIPTVGFVGTTFSNLYAFNVIVLSDKAFHIALTDFTSIADYRPSQRSHHTAIPNKHIFFVTTQLVTDGVEDA